ncbi:MAG TPA: alkaline phosphatase family protein, partial [Candidatus Polarisedimenticolia bacterium]|nr:alkaline phosphatase family protein [Candidatus Polarisedimenticolia bacterium]
MTRSRIIAASLAVLACVYALGSIRRLDGKDRLYVVDFPAVASSARVVAPGWHVVPRLLARVTEYPPSQRKMRVDLSGDRAAASKEGATVEIEAELVYGVDSSRVLDLHRAHGPAYETAWLDGLVRKETAAALAAASYDRVRDRDPQLTRALRASIAGQAEGAGIRIEGLRLVPIAAAGEVAGTIRRADASPIDREVVLIGVDSFDWRIIDPLLKAGRMPHLASLIARGTRSNLKTIRPILSPVIWTSIATGMKPSRHGIVDFVVNARDTGALVPVTSAMRQVPALWTLMSRQGVDVSVVAWWATWPAETVRGSMVTDRVAFQLFNAEAREDWKSADPAKSRGKTYPAQLFESVRPLIKSPSDVTDEEVGWFLPGRKFPASPTEEQRRRLNEFRTVIAAGETYHAIALERFRASGHALKMVYYEGPDTASHLFMRDRPPALPGVDRRDLELFGDIIDRYYERQDRFIGEIVAAAGPDASILVVSDHGFKSDANRPLRGDPSIDKGNAADWHTPVGVLVMAGPDIRRGVELASASILDIAPTILSLYGLPIARDMDGQPLTEGMTPEFLARRPVSWIDSYGGVRSIQEEAMTADAAGNADLVEKLRALGYIGEERMTAHNNRGVIALDEGDVDGAITDFEKALQTGGQGAMIRANLA